MGIEGLSLTPIFLILHVRSVNLRANARNVRERLTFEIDGTL